MLPDSLPPPIRDSIYAVLGFPVVAADELSRAGRRLSHEVDGWLGRGLTQVTDSAHRWAEQVPTVSVRPPSLEGLGGRVDARVRAVEERLAELDQRVEQVLHRLEEQLPDPARDAVSRTRSHLRTFVPSRN